VIPPSTFSVCVALQRHYPDWERPHTCHPVRICLTEWLWSLAINLIKTGMEQVGHKCRMLIMSWCGWRRKLEWCIRHAKATTEKADRNVFRRLSTHLHPNKHFNIFTASRRVKSDIKIHTIRHESAISKQCRQVCPNGQRVCPRVHTGGRETLRMMTGGTGRTWSFVCHKED
jgi:hypothetical protein